MRPILLALVLPLALAACDSAQKPAATTPAEQPATQPAANTPAAEAPAAAPTQAALVPVTGTWGFDAPACTAPIAIAANAFEGAENTCEITGWSDNGDGTLTARMNCDSQGQKTTESITMTPLFGPAGEGIRLDYVDRGGDPVTVFRCSRAE